MDLNKLAELTTKLAVLQSKMDKELEPNADYYFDDFMYIRKQFRDNSLPFKMEWTEFAKDTVFVEEESSEEDAWEESFVEEESSWEEEEESSEEY